MFDYPIIELMFQVY